MSVIAFTAARVPSARLSLYDICVSADSGLWNCAVYGTVKISIRSDPNCWRSGLVTFSISAAGNCTGLSGSSVSEDSHVPGTEITCTSGQLASWNSGRGFFVVGGTPVGGTAEGGSAVDGVSGLRSTTITIATINT